MYVSFDFFSIIMTIGIGQIVFLTIVILGMKKANWKVHRIPGEKQSKKYKRSILSKVFNDVKCRQIGE